MIKLLLDKHDFVSAVEGFAHGSHLRQHVWRDIVYKSIPQMTVDEMYFFWYIFRRNLWDCYFYNSQRRCGWEDYLHALAALHLNNRYNVIFKSDKMKNKEEVICYRFDGKYRPLFLKDELQSFDSYIPKEWIISVDSHPIRTENPFIQDGKEEWWRDLSVYDNLCKD